MDKYKKYLVMALVGIMLLTGFAPIILNIVNAIN